MIFDPVYWILIIGIMAMMGLASKNVQSTFKKYSEVPIRVRMTGAQAARQILDRNGLQNIQVERVQGELTDHYDPQGKVLRLSQPVYDSASVSAVGVAAHEAGHALQDKSNYFPLRFRQGFYPLASIGSNLGMMLVFFGLIGTMILGQFGTLIALAGLGLYACAVFFTIITLPVEFNASSRAMQCLQSYGIVTSEEYSNTQKVLNAAAMTYVAAAVGAVLTLLYWAMLIMGQNE